jgi:hypothetical protein
MYGEKRVESSYIQIDDNPSNKIKIEKILDFLKTYVINNSLEMFVFIVHNMIEFRTHVYKINSSGIEENQYNEYTSRGSTIMPSVEKEMTK